MFGKILNATVSGLTAIPFAFAAYHVCKNLFADEKPAPEEKEGQAPDEQSQDGAAQQKSAENVESEAQAPVIISTMRMALEKLGQRSKSAVAKPVVEMMLAT